MASSAMQILAFALALLGVLGATVATLLPNWKVSADVGSNIMTAISQMQGLWMDCTWYSTGVFSCTLKYSVLSLPAYLQTARTTMVLSCMMACLGLCLAALGLKCTRWGGSHRAKGHAAIGAGGCFILAGILCLVPASWFTNEVITTFLDSNIPESSKYEPGGAVYVTFVSAGLLLAGGVIFCLSCPGKREGQLDYTSTSTSTTFPDKLLQQQINQEQIQRDQLQRDLILREQLQRGQKDFEQQTSPNEQSSREQLQWGDKGPQDEAHEADEIQQEEPLQEKPLHEDKGTQQFYSPSRVPPKDARAGYSLQDYV
ncbi:claudin-20-like [Oncorhynchus tshawytscha]|uniref:Claudin n=1 Tax=Oncorhynchus tshawytscha TaxID=74940 RepID=A0AAZ3PHL2_ONCTS|nr:claudin-20-like [Oncorhynchus tshawytscha]